MAEQRKEAARTEEEGLARREPLFFGGPFGMLNRFAQEMDTLFDDFGVGRGWFTPRPGFGGLRPLVGRADRWVPDIDVFQRHSDLVIRADLPGLTKGDVKVDVTEDAVTIQGERKQEHEEEKGGVYRSERSYGSFYRVVGLPEGAMTEQAKATFKDGILEVTMPAPPETVKGGRRLEIAEASAQKK